MTTIDKRTLKAFIRLDGAHRDVSGSLVLRKNKPKVGKWREVDAYECCNSTVITTTTQYCEGPLCNTVLTVGSPVPGTYGYYTGVFGGLSPACSDTIGLYWAEGTPNVLQLYVGADYGVSVIVEINGTAYTLSLLGSGPPFWYYFAEVVTNPFPTIGNTVTMRICGTEVTTTTTEEPFSGLKFTYTEGNVPESMENYLSFANGYSYSDVTQDIVINSIILTGAIDQITQIGVNNQIELTEIDGLVNCTSLEELYCFDCTGLSVLPTLPDALQQLYCFGCTGLNVLPTLPDALEELGCSDCTGLSVLPTLPDALQILGCDGCNLTAIEMDANAIELDTAGLSGGCWMWSPQANLAEPNQSAAAYLALIGKSWNFSGCV